MARALWKGTKSTLKEPGGEEHAEVIDLMERLQRSLQGASPKKRSLKGAVTPKKNKRGGTATRRAARGRRTRGAA